MTELRPSHQGTMSSRLIVPLLTYLDKRGYDTTVPLLRAGLHRDDVLNPAALPFSSRSRPITAPQIAAAPERTRKGRMISESWSQLSIKRSSFTSRPSVPCSVRRATP